VADSTTSAAASISIPSLAFAGAITYFMLMPHTYSAQLISIDGADALAFAQAQFSSNLAALGDGHWQWSAWLDAQGRVRALFHLLRLDEQHFCLLLRGGDAADLAAQMQRFVLRAKVGITPQPPLSLSTGDAMAMHTFAQQANTIALGCGSHSLIVASRNDDDWRLAQLRAGWPWLPDALLGQLLPASLGLEALGATALDKGCYPGQEIVARLHYRGGHKRHLYRVRLSLTLPPGSELHVENEPAIQLLDVMPINGFAEALAIVHENLAPLIDKGIHALHAQNPVLVHSLEHA